MIGEVCLARLHCHAGIPLIVPGVVTFVSGDFVGAVWWFILGLFLRGVTQLSYQQLSYQQLLVRRTLERETVGRLARVRGRLRLQTSLQCWQVLVEVNRDGE